MLVAGSSDLDELERGYTKLTPDLKYPIPSQNAPESPRFFADSKERSSIRDGRPCIFEHAMIDLVPLLASGAERRDDGVVAKPRGHGVERDLQVNPRR